MNKSLEDQLLTAVVKDDLKTVEHLLSGGVTDKQLIDRALATASGKGEPMIDRLLRAGANPEQRGLIGTLLMDASMRGSLPIVKRLIAAGANPNRQLGRESALSAAMSDNKLAVMEHLEGLQAKVDPSLALRYVSEHGDLPRAERALAAGADINAVTGSPLEETPLIAAASKGQLQMVQWLLEHGANPRKEAKGHTALFCAVAYAKSLPMVEVLIAAGCNPDSAYYHETALMAAASQGDLTMVKRLIALGANIQTRDTDRGMTVLDYAKESKNKELVAFLASKGLNAERDTGRNLARALKRTYGGNIVEHSQGIMINSRFAGHKCQFHVDPDKCNVSIFGLRYHPDVFSGKPPDITLGLSKPTVPIGHQSTSLAPDVGEKLGLKVYSLLPAKDPGQSGLVQFCQRLEPAVRKLALQEGEFLHFSGGFAGFVWHEKEIEPVLKRLECFSELLTPLVRSMQPERRLFDHEWVIKPVPKSASVTAKATHTFGGMIEPPIACPHCQSAGNPIIQIDLTDPALPRTTLKRSTLSVTWCLECGEWDPVFYDISEEIPEPLSPGLKSRPTPVSPPGIDYLPARRMMLVLVPPGKKAGRKSKFGGSPSWIQNDDTPDCPSCSKPMAFVLQMASDARISYADMGMLYAFACPECRTLASLVQSH